MPTCVLSHPAELVSENNVRMRPFCPICITFIPRGPNLLGGVYLLLQSPWPSKVKCLFTRSHTTLDTSTKQNVKWGYAKVSTRTVSKGIHSFRGYDQTSSFLAVLILLLAHRWSTVLRKWIVVGLTLKGRNNGLVTMMGFVVRKMPSPEQFPS